MQKIKVPSAVTAGSRAQGWVWGAQFCLKYSCAAAAVGHERRRTDVTPVLQEAVLRGPCYDLFLGRLTS